MNGRTRVVLLAIGLLETAVVYFHVLGIQQTRYWSWAFRTGRLIDLGPALLLATLPIAVAIGLHLASRGPIVLRLLLLACSVVLIQPLGLVLAYHPADVHLPVALVEDRYAGSYWYDARLIERQNLSIPEILRSYPQRLPLMYVHTRNKPPGFVLFYDVLLRWFGTENDRAALMGVCIIALGTAAGVPGVYALGVELLGETDAAFWAALLFALTPAVLGVFPQSDSCFAAVGCAMVWLWLRALRTGRAVFAVTLGALLAGVLFCTSNLLVLGILMLALVEWERRSGHTTAWRTALGFTALIAVEVLTVYILLFLMAGYHPIATARVYIGNEYRFEHSIAHRPWPWIVPSDFFHFAFGTGRMLILLGASALLIPATVSTAPQRTAVRLCLGEIVFVGLGGFLRGETARLWIFLVPLLVIPAGWALARWPVRWRVAIVGLLFVFAVVMLQNVEFNMRPGPG